MQREKCNTFLCYKEEGDPQNIHTAVYMHTFPLPPRLPLGRWKVVDTVEKTS